MTAAAAAENTEPVPQFWSQTPTGQEERVMPGPKRDDDLHEREVDDLDDIDDLGLDDDDDIDEREILDEDEIDEKPPGLDEFEDAETVTGAPLRELREPWPSLPPAQRRWPAPSPPAGISSVVAPRSVPNVRRASPVPVFERPPPPPPLVEVEGPTVVPAPHHAPPTPAPAIVVAKPQDSGVNAWPSYRRLTTGPDLVSTAPLTAAMPTRRRGLLGWLQSVIHGPSDYDLLVAELQEQGIEGEELALYVRAHAARSGGDEL